MSFGFFQLTRESNESEQSTKEMLLPPATELEKEIECYKKEADELGNLLKTNLSLANDSNDDKSAVERIQVN